QILRPVCAVLAEAHRAGILHRDVKPANILLHRGEDGEVVKLLDFGIARIEHADVGNLTTAGRLLGTPMYMSPERLLGRPYDPRADVYGVGVTLSGAPAGRAPCDTPEPGLPAPALRFPHDERAPLRAHRPDLPQAPEDLVRRAMARNPEDRPSA